MRFGFIIIMIAVSTLILGHRQLAESQESIDLQISAHCLPHSEVSSPNSMSVRFFNRSTPEGTDLKAFLSVDGRPDLVATDHRWDYPDKGSLSSLFPGPTVRAQTFCQTSPDTRAMHLSYYRQRGVRLFLSQTEGFSMKELDAIDGPTSSLLNLAPSGPYQNEYIAGNGDLSPYWLQFSLPVHSVPSLNTSIRYRFP
jgi:hypothetical protein